MTKFEAAMTKIETLNKRLANLREHEAELLREIAALESRAASIRDEKARPRRYEVKGYALFGFGCRAGKVATENQLQYWRNVREAQAEIRSTYEENWLIAAGEW
jgi:septal ring factor EnvC (AmiA/AmiB activator)